MNCFKNGWTATLPELINVSQDELVPTQVRHEHIHCDPAQRLACLVYILRTELQQPTSLSLVSLPLVAQTERVGEGMHMEGAEGEDQAKQAIVFLDDVGDVEQVKSAVIKALTALGIPTSSGGGSKEKNRKGDPAVGVLLETMSLDARAKTMAEFRDGTTRVMVCSDLGTRGLDLPNTSLVVQVRAIIIFSFSLPSISGLCAMCVSFCAVDAAP